MLCGRELLYLLTKMLMQVRGLVDLYGLSVDDDVASALLHLDELGVFNEVILLHLLMES